VLGAPIISGMWGLFVLVTPPLMQVNISSRRPSRRWAHSLDRSLFQDHPNGIGLFALPAIIPAGDGAALYFVDACATSSRRCPAASG